MCLHVVNLKLVSTTSAKFSCTAWFDKENARFQNKTVVSDKEEFYLDRSAIGTPGIN